MKLRRNYHESESLSRNPFSNIKNSFTFIVPNGTRVPTEHIFYPRTLILTNCDVRYFYRQYGNFSVLFCDWSVGVNESIESIQSQILEKPRGAGVSPGTMFVQIKWNDVYPHTQVTTISFTNQRKCQRFSMVQSFIVLSECDIPCV